MRRFIIRALVFVCLIFTLPSLARAQISSDFGGANGGAVVIGESTTTCNSSIEGAIRYDSATPCVELCDGSSWACAGSGGCSAPSDCSTVGDVCTDGSIFAGVVVYGNSSCEPLYVTDSDQSSGVQWKNATGTDDINPDDVVDGQANHANRGGNLADFPAFNLCEAGSYHGKDDWYLPAREEMQLLWVNASAIGNIANKGYWTSTEVDGSVGSAYDFDTDEITGASGIQTKTQNSPNVRCVRRD